MLKTFPSAKIPQRKLGGIASKLSATYGHELDQEVGMLFTLPGCSAGIASPPMLITNVKPCMKPERLTPKPL